MDKFKDINAIIKIIDGEVKIEIMTNKDGLVKNDLDQLLLLKNLIVDDALFYYESRYQRRYIPNETTVYILPKDNCQIL